LPRTGGREAARVESDELSCEGVAANETSKTKQMRAETVFFIFMGIKPVALLRNERNENQPRRNEEHEERSEKAFVSSFLRG
jgi:hypothetical protein